MLVFADEAWLDSQSVIEQPWRANGETPVVRVSNSRYRLNMMAENRPDGTLYFITIEGKVIAEIFPIFPETIMQDIDK